MKKILEFTHQEAREFLLKPESYVSFDLPPYFKFSGLLDKLSEKIGSKRLEEFYRVITKSDGETKKLLPNQYEDVNYLMLNNKDGKYAWRPFQIIHPVIYVALVHKITEESNWDLISKRFEEFSNNSKIVCHSIPCESDSDLSDKATSVVNWWQSIEQNSLELALQYEYVMHTDITDCYGTIYTHSISWAIHTKPVAKKYRGTSYIGNLIDKYVREMSYGQTNGIPQGSVLMDFIAEMVLGYIDLELTQKINESAITDYHILRYRDDYRIFTNNPQEAEEITKYLTEILIELGMRLNTNKTLVSSNVIRDSVKEDKHYWNYSKKSSKSIQGHLLILHNLSEKYPNSGSLSKALNKFYSRVSSLEESEESLKVLISIIVDIGFKNPRTYPIVCGILSKFLSLMDNDAEKEVLLNQIDNRFSRIPNTGYIKIWLQRITIKIDRDRGYDEPMCIKVNDDSTRIWNSRWLKKDLRQIISQVNIIDEDVISNIDRIIGSEEIQLFDYSY